MPFILLLLNFTLMQRLVFLKSCSFCELYSSSYRVNSFNVNQFFLVFSNDKGPVYDFYTCSNRLSDDCRKERGEKGLDYRSICKIEREEVSIFACW